MDENYEGALAEFAIAQRLAPSNANIGLLVAAIHRRQGHWEECLAGLERSQRLDPENPNIVRNIVFTNSALRRFPEAARAAQRWRAMSPDSLVARIQAAYLDFQGKGETTAFTAALAQIPVGDDPDGVVTACAWDGAMIERDFARAKEILAASPLSEISYLNGGLTPKSFLAGCTAVALGDPVLAKTNLEAARKVFENAIVDAPNNAERHANLGLCYAFMGEKENAMREGRRAVELKPETKDATDGALMNCSLALIYARVGENALATALIERLLRTPGAVDSVNYSITVNDLKLRWEWDPLRNDPAFQKLVSAP
jgi:serine/threonine-protein kinase